MRGEEEGKRSAEGQEEVGEGQEEEYPQQVSRAACRETSGPEDGARL